VRGTARSRTAGEYLFEELVALSSQVMDSPVNPARFSCQIHDNPEARSVMRELAGFD
jgi:hypothetical protein